MKILCGLALLLAGCAPTLTQTALTNGAGRWQVAPELGVVAIGLDERAGVLPTPAVAARYGITDAVDLGLRVGPGLAEVQGKVLLTEAGPTRAEGVAVALAPTVAFAAGDLAGSGPVWSRVSAPVLVDLPVGPHRAVFGARLAAVVAPGHARGINQGWEISGGVSAGFAVALGRAVQLLPELGFDLPLLGRATQLPGASAPQLNVRFGVLLGGSPAKVAR